MPLAGNGLNIGFNFLDLPSLFSTTGRMSLNVVFVLLALLLSVIGLIGAFLPGLPGSLLSWGALLLLFFAPDISFQWFFLIITLVISVAVFVADFILPALGAKKFGGTRKGMIGSVLGMLIGLFLPIPAGFLLGAFIGAYLGELIGRASYERAFKAAFGSFIWFIVSTFAKVMLGVIYLYLLVSKVWEHKTILFI